jgi:predicted FMN-binding regulatory protein PaiB
MAIKKFEKKNGDLFFLGVNSKKNGKQPKSQNHNFLNKNFMGFLVKGGEGDIVVDDLPFFLFKKLKNHIFLHFKILGIAM